MNVQSYYIFCYFFKNMHIRKTTYIQNKIDLYSFDHNIKSYSNIIRIGGKRKIQTLY